jgi:hypothetical protein
MSVKKLSERLTAAKDATAEAVAELESGRVTLAERKKEWQRAVSAPPPPSDLKELAERAVRRTGADFVAAYGSSIIRSVASEAGGDRANGSIPLRAFCERDPFGFLCAGDPEGVSKALAFILKLVPHYEPGPPLREVDKVVDGLLKEIAQLEEADEALTDELQAAGIAVQHRPEVVVRRQEAAARADAKRRSVENREARQAAADRAVAETGVPAARVVG